MRRLSQIVALVVAGCFVAGCWSEPIERRTMAENDKIPFNSHSKEKRALLKKLGKAPAEATKPAEAAPATEKAEQPAK